MPAPSPARGSARRAAMFEMQRMLMRVGDDLMRLLALDVAMKPTPQESFSSDRS